MVKINPKKMKVAELKAELEARDITIEKGMKKADLVGLLTSAMDVEFSSGADTAEESTTSDVGDSVNTTNQSEDYETAKDDTISSYKETEISGSFHDVQETDTTEEKSIVEEKESDEPETKEEPPVIENIEPVETNLNDPASIPQDAVLNEEEKMETEPSSVIDAEIPVEEVEEKVNEPDEISMQVEQVESEKEKDQEIIETNLNHSNANSTTVDENEAQKAENETAMSTEDVEKVEQQEESKDVTKKIESNSEKKDDSTQLPAESQEKEKESQENETSRKRRLDDSYERKNRYEERYVPPAEEPIEEFDESLVVLDAYDNDLNLKLHRDRLTAQTLTLESFAYLWGGARATYGVREGKICYECKLLEEHSVRHLPSTEEYRHMIRVGWSSNDTPLRLGECELSYGFCRSGKAVTNATSTDFGEAVNEGDVIGCYLDLSGEEKFKISFTKNGVMLGTPFIEDKEKLGEKVLFPHLACRNMTVEFNFGAKEEQFFPHPEEFADYSFLSTIPLEKRIRGTERPKSRKDCEVIMLCGLPGAGKTHWTNKHVKENPDKKYQVLGIQDLLTRMKVTGLVEEGRTPDIVMQHASNCLNRLFQVSSRKNRNFIFDQTNVFASAQRRKLRAFEGYRRKAVVVVPADEEFKIRLEKHVKDEQKEIPDMAVYEMKANFTMPEEGDLFEEVVFAELPKEEASLLIEQYREEAKKKGPPPEKRFRGGFDSGTGGWNNRSGEMMRPNYHGGNRGGYNNFGGGSRGGNRNYGGFGGDNRRNQGGGWNNNKGGGNWNQNRGYGNRNSGGYGGNRGGMNRNSSGGFNNNNFDRNQGNNYNNRNHNKPHESQNNRRQNNNYGQNRNQRQPNSTNYSNQHQAYQQQTAQLAAQSNNQRQQQVQPQQTAPQQANQQQAYQQQAYNAQTGQPDYSQQWAQYYQQQAASQQQQQAAVAAATAAQYQNYYASYQQAYGAAANPGSNNAPQ